MTPKYFFAIAGILVFTFAFEADALQCYLCGTATPFGMQNCTDDFKGIDTNCNFSPQSPMCIKQMSGGKVIHRGCYVKGYCQDNPDCFECETDLCNSSNSLILPLVLINTLIFLLFRLL
ncbi:uncharacterized protein LOC134834403 [Culicoides brevitarsis]|uniref:uncharacterized protein LOC134834403 n=1 Tax=Culicoides brevitarsis TaxID=469753 RepID=UPI00307CB276